jgi:hypothetical protein
LIITALLMDGAAVGLVILQSKSAISYSKEVYNGEE